MKITCTLAIVVWPTPLKTGLHDIRIRVTYQRKVKYFSLGISAKLESWDKQNARLSPTKAFQKENALISEYESKANKIAYQFAYLGNPFSFEDFSKELFPNYKIVNNSTNIADYLLIQQNKYENDKKISSADIRKATRNWIVKSNFPKKFEDVKTSHIYEFVDYVRKNSAVKDNTIKVYLSVLLNVFKEAKKEGIYPAANDPFGSFKIKLDTSANKRAISPENLQKIFDYKCANASQQFYKKLFELSFYLRGMNIADIIRLPINCIQEGRIYYSRKKTKYKHSIKIAPQAQLIIETYKALDGEYLFAILKKGLTERQMKNKTSDTTKKLSKIIGHVCKELNIPGGQSVTFYAARHSYATMLLHSGADHSVIKSAMGHSSFATTEKYLKDLDKSYIDDADYKIFNK
jgi:site-specific recombinase XerD